MKVKVTGTYYSSYENIGDCVELGTLLGQVLEAKEEIDYCIFTGHTTRYYELTTKNGMKIKAHFRDCEVVEDVVTGSSVSMKKCCEIPNIKKTTYKLFGQVKPNDVYYYCTSCKQETDKEGWVIVC